jgi:hypothetical protein
MDLIDRKDRKSRHMKPILIFLFALLIYANSFAQDTLFVLHPLVGDTIDKTEKMNYLLFPSIPNDDFKYCYLTRSNEQFFVNSYALNDSISIQPIDTTELRQYRINLDKFLAFYLNKSKNDSLKQAEKLDLKSNRLNPAFNNKSLVGEQSRERIIQEVDRDNRMKTDLERANLTKQGLDLNGGGAYFQFFSTGKKKKK